jgi:hypothetical protein
LDFSGTNASGADTKCFVDAIHQGAHPAQIGIPAALSDVVGVADPVAKVGGLSANFAFTSHKKHLRGWMSSKTPQRILPEINPFAHPFAHQFCS